MRIIAGKYGGRRLKAVPGMNTRPTTDKVKESMFNIIGPYFDGGNVLDLYAGSGGLSIEAVSRGADQAYLIDRQYQAIKTIKKNVDITKEANKFHLLKMNSRKALLQLATLQIKFNFIFLDPPYKQQKIINDINQMVKLKLLNNNAVIVCETDKNANLPRDLKSFKFIKKVMYGITVLTIYRFQEDKL